MDTMKVQAMACLILLNVALSMQSAVEFSVDFDGEESRAVHRGLFHIGANESIAPAQLVSAGVAAGWWCSLRERGDVRMRPASRLVRMLNDQQLGGEMGDTMDISGIVDADFSLRIIDREGLPFVEHLRAALVRNDREIILEAIMQMINDLDRRDTIPVRGMANGSFLDYLYADDLGPSSVGDVMRMTTFNDRLGAVRHSVLTVVRSILGRYPSSGLLSENDKRDLFNLYFMFKVNAALSDVWYLDPHYSMTFGLSDIINDIFSLRAINLCGESCGYSLFNSALYSTPEPNEFYQHAYLIPRDHVERFVGRLSAGRSDFEKKWHPELDALLEILRSSDREDRLLVLFYQG